MCFSIIWVITDTHEQNFNRLVKKIDELKRDGVIEDEVFIQTGFSDYEPTHCKYSKLIPYSDMIKYVERARIVITHGAPASFIMPLQINKTPIVVPRQHKFNEHVNDHQVDFTLKVAKRMENIIPVIDIEEIENIIKNYDEIVSLMKSGIESNNKKFNEELEKIVNSLF